jgi:hypothetical protein
MTKLNMACPNRRKLGQMRASLEFTTQIFQIACTIANISVASTRNETSS